MIARDVFISHSSEDAETARQLRAVLEGAGYSCWMAPDDIVGTDTWTEQILAAIKGSRAMIVLISSASNKSPHVSREVNLALGRSRAVLPLRIENVPPEGSLEYLLSLVQRLDAFPPPVTDHSDRILRRIQTIVTRPPSDPAGPSQADTAPIPQRTPTTPTPKEAPTGPAGDGPKAPAGEGPAAPAPIGVGSIVGGFTIEAILGEGGMATVYRARQAEPNRAVALKVIRADRAADASYRQRFLAEKETLAALEHPSIVPIYAAGDSNGVLYIAMRLVDGPDLQERIAREGRLEPRDTVEVLKPIADAVDYAHAMGVLHRDLKPSNIILDRAGRPYLTDFGLGKQVEGGAGLSSPGVAIGTLDYMAPEQFTGSMGGKTGDAVDIYALGCVAFACLTGRAPFIGDSPEQLMYAHAHEVPPSVRSLRPDVPAAVDDVMARVLSKDPAARYASAREFVAALDAAARAPVGEPAPPPPIPVPAPAPSPVPAPSPSPSPSPGPAPIRAVPNRTLLLAGGAVALVLVALLGANLLSKPGSSPAPSDVAVATTSPGATNAGPPKTDAPSVAPTTPPLTPEETRLLDVLPAMGGIDRCTHWDASPGSADVLSQTGYPGALARLTCPGPSAGSSDMRYVRYPSAALLQADYDAIVAASGIDGTGAGCGTQLNESTPWNIPTFPNSGDLACIDTGDGIQFVWTHQQLRVLGQWRAPDRATGFAIWQQWTVTLNSFERQLLAKLPPSVDDTGDCRRAADLYYLKSLAILACPAPNGGQSAFYALFPAADAGAGDPMSTEYDAIMTNGGWPDDTTAGCYSKPPTYGRQRWGFSDGNGGIGPTQGNIGCYLQTTENPLVQYAWTYNASAVMGLWAAPDLKTGIDYFDKVWLIGLPR